MVAKVILGTMQNAKKLVNIAEHISCDVELCSGRYVVDAKSMLGVLSLPGFKVGELHIHTDEETELLTGKVSPEEAAAVLFQKGIKIAVVTLGSKGAYLYCKEGGAHVSGFVSKAVDTNGAGDSFWGGFLYCISKSGKSPEQFTMEELKDYVRFGNAVASLCVEKKGAIPAMPELEKVKERMES